MTLRVITATRGDSALLAETVLSVAALAGPVRHVLVCPAAMRARLAQAFPQCAVVPEQGPGLYAALNTGLDAPGDEEFVTWINDDDVLVPEGIAIALRRFAADATLGATYGRVELIDAAGARLGELPVARRAADLRPLLGAGLMPLAQPGTIFRRRALEPVGRFDPAFRLAGDLDLFARALAQGVGFAFVPAVVARFRLHGGQLSKDEATATREHARVVATLPPAPALLATLRFRLSNLAVYLERVRRHGFKRMSTLYRHG